MRLWVVILAVFFIGAQAASSDKDSIDIDVSTIKPHMKGDSKLPQNGGDDDEEEGSAVQGDAASGREISGSGETTTAFAKTTPTDEIIMAKAITPSRSTEKSEKLTQHPTKGRKTTMKPIVTDMSTEKSIDVVKKNEETIEPTTEDDSMFGGGVSNTDEPDVQARKQDDTATLSVLTNEVIAAVVVGGVCAIILIAFLVYRLRKRDEGSYVLTDSAYKDTNKLRGDTGKEAFV